MADGDAVAVTCEGQEREEWQATPAAAACEQRAVSRWQAGTVADTQDALAQEVPIALVYNGISHVVMLASPADLEDFAYGFSLTEGIITDRAQIYSIELWAIYDPVDAAGADKKLWAQGTDKQSATPCQTLQGIEVHIQLASAQFNALKAQRRNLTGRTGCGLCGAESLQQVFKQPSQPLQGSRIPLTQQAIDHALQALKALQPLQQATGATHACALVDVDGQVLSVREDVGRHNALDKLIGSLLQDPQRHVDPGARLWQAHWVLTTSRASYEMVQKVMMAGGHALVAMSAPTALAARLANAHDVLLVGFTRPGQCVVYSGQLN